MAIDRSKVNTPKGFPGSKSLSKARMPQGKDHSSSNLLKGKAFKADSFPGSKCVNSAHGLTSNSSPTKGMIHPDNRIGANKKGFGSANYKQGPCPISKGKKGNPHSY